MIIPIGGKRARVYMWTSQRLELEGADVQLFCRPDGSPKPSVRWYDTMGKQIDETSQQYSVSTMATVHVFH